MMQDKEKKRLFVAVELPEYIRGALAARQQGLSGIRWAHGDTLHLTVRFIGEVFPVQAEAIKESLKTVRAASFTLQVSGLGFFDQRAQALVWAGLSESAELYALKSSVDAALERHAGLPCPAGGFSPHITLGRARQADRKALQIFTAAELAVAAFRVDSFALFRSVLTPDRAVHTAEARYTLQ